MYFLIEDDFSTCITINEDGTKAVAIYDGTNSSPLDLAGKTNGAGLHVTFTSLEKFQQHFKEIKTFINQIDHGNPKRKRKENEKEDRQEEGLAQEKKRKTKSKDKKQVLNYPDTPAPFVKRETCLSQADNATKKNVVR